MIQVQENELLGYSLRPLGDAGAALVARMSDEEATAVRAALAQVLLDESSQPGEPRVEVAATTIPAGAPFSSVVYRDIGADGTRKMVTFAFRDAAVETALPLLGIAIAVFTGKAGLASLPQVGGVIKTLWSKLVVLKRPQDSDAIDLLEAMSRVRARHLLLGAGEYPSGGDLVRELSLGAEAVTRALTRLRSAGVVEAVAWGGQTGDLGNAANRWRVKL
jgi:hypothetical protein